MSCRKCQGTRRVPSRVDGGRCWACGPQASNPQVNRRPETKEELDAEIAASQAARRARRAAQR